MNGQMKGYSHVNKKALEQYGRGGGGDPLSGFRSLGMRDSRSEGMPSPLPPSVIPKTEE